MLKTTLLLGCGNTRDKRTGRPGDERVFPPAAKSVGAALDNGGLVTVDMDPNCGALVQHDLEKIPLPFPDEVFDEIHAYEVLEHVGRTGDWRFFFGQFTDFWRMLKPGGIVCASVPVLGTANERTDPGHSRRFCTEWLTWLMQPAYTEQVGKTMATDYRHFYTADFEWPTVDGKKFGPGRHDGSDYFVLVKISPSRITI